MKRYPAYKNSGIEWSPQIPENWQARPVKTWFDVQLGKMLQNDSESPLDKKVPYLKALHVTWGQVQTEDLPEMWASQTQIIQYGVKNGDLLVCEGGEVGRSGIVTNPPVDCIIQNALHRVRAKNNAHISYLMYVLFAMGGVDWFSILCNKATISHFTREKFVDSKIPLPSFDEQTSISSYLDRKTKEIDGLISKKERMIELLREERAAVINQAVTKVGEVKDSGVEWLGKIPKHWGLKRLKYLVKLINEERAINDNSLHVDLENIESWTGQLIKTDTITAMDEEMKQFIPGDILFNKLRPYLAKVFHARQEGICGGELLVLRPSMQLDSKFLFYKAISSDFISIIDGSTYGTKMPRASWDFIGNLFIPYPSIEEQRRVVDYLDRKVAQIDAQIGREKKSIKLLKEYRTSLISEIVTGKICVCD